MKNRAAQRANLHKRTEQRNRTKDKPRFPRHAYSIRGSSHPPRTTPFLYVYTCRTRICVYLYIYIYSTRTWFIRLRDRERKSNVSDEPNKSSVYRVSTLLIFVSHCRHMNSPNCAYIRSLLPTDEIFFSHPLHDRKGSVR